MTFSDYTLQAEKIGDILKKKRTSAKTGKKPATNVKKNRGRALKFSAKIGIETAIENLKAVLSTNPHVKTFYHAAKRIYFEKKSLDINIKTIF